MVTFLKRERERERERFLTVWVIERNFRSKRRKLFVIEEGKKKKKKKMEKIADESFLLRPNSFLSAQQDQVDL